MPPETPGQALDAALAKLATKDDLLAAVAGLATKSELEALRREVATLATKDELAAVEARLDARIDELASRMERLHADGKAHARELANAQAERLADELRRIVGPLVAAKPRGPAE